MQISNKRTIVRSVLLRNISRAAVQNAQKMKIFFQHFCVFFCEELFFVFKKNNKPNRRKTRKKPIHIRNEIQYSYDNFFLLDTLNSFYYFVDVDIKTLHIVLIQLLKAV